MKYVFNEEGEQQFPLLRIQRKRVPRWGTMAFEELATHKLKKKKKNQMSEAFSRTEMQGNCQLKISSDRLKCALFPRNHLISKNLKSLALFLTCNHQGSFPQLDLSQQPRATFSELLACYSPLPVGLSQKLT